MDRYSDMVLYMGLMILYARLERTPLMVLVWVAAFGSFMTSYARARAESLIPRCTVGLLERPERIVLIVLGALTNRMVAALWIIAVLSNLTAIQRVVYTYVELKRGWSARARRRGHMSFNERSEAPGGVSERAAVLGLAVEDPSPRRVRGAARAGAGRGLLHGLPARRVAHAEPVPLDLLRRPGHGRGDVHRRPRDGPLEGAPPPWPCS